LPIFRQQTLLASVVEELYDDSTAGKYRTTHSQPPDSTRPGVRASVGDRSGGALKRGTVYITLQRMESKGYVESRLEAQPERAMGRPRRWYRPSEYGRQVLNAWAIAEHALEAGQ